MCFHQSQKEKKKKKKIGEALHLFPVFVLLILKTRRGGKVGQPELLLSVLTGYRRKHSVLFLTALRAPSLKLLAQTGPGPPTVKKKTFVLGTRADRRLFKTELFLIYV